MNRRELLKLGVCAAIPLPITPLQIDRDIRTGNLISVEIQPHGNYLGICTKVLKGGNHGGASHAAYTEFARRITNTLS